MPSDTAADVSTLDDTADQADSATVPQDTLVPDIVALAAASPLIRVQWADRGRAPAGYIKGMALAYARVCRKLVAGDPAATDMAKAETAAPDTDALAFYHDRFAAAGMSNAEDGQDTLRHLFVLLTGLGMRESSGSYCEGRDPGANNTGADTAEAGLFQTSFNAAAHTPLMRTLFDDYTQNPSGFLDVFREGVTCSAANLRNFGDGDGHDFQALSKSCPAFAVEFAAVGLRHVRTHWGPINAKKAELRPEADALFRQVEQRLDQSPTSDAVLG